MLLVLFTHNTNTLKNKLDKLRNDINTNHYKNIILYIIDSSDQFIIQNKNLLESITTFPSYIVPAPVQGSIGNKIQYLLHNIDNPDYIIFYNIDLENNQLNLPDKFPTIDEQTPYQYIINSNKEVSQIIVSSIIAQQYILSDPRIQSFEEILFSLASAIGEYDKTDKNNLDKKQRENIKFINDNIEKIEWLKNKKESCKKNNYSPVIHIDGALGDMIMSIPLLRSFKDKEITVSCISPQLLDWIPSIKGFIDWNDKSIGGNIDGNRLGMFVYDYGEKTNQKYIPEAFCKMYGKQYDKNLWNIPEKFIDKNTYEIIEQQIINTGVKNKIVCISPFASFNNGKKSNKNWKSEDWLEIVMYLQSLGYYVIHVGSSTDEIIPLVNDRFFNKSFQDVVSLLKQSQFVITVESYIHHLSSILHVPTLVLNPKNNQHIHHEGIIYIEKENSEIKNYTNKWWLDIQQPERKLSVNLIQVSDVKEKINQLAKIDNKLYNEL